MEINNYKYLDQLGRLGKPLVLSTGMASSKEIENAIEVLNKTGNNDLIILHCVSIYPSKVEIINLNNIKVSGGNLVIILLVFQIILRELVSQLRLLL